MAALLETAPEGDTLTAVYQLALHYETGNWEAVDEIAHRAGIEPSAFRDAYCKAVCWADETLADLPQTRTSYRPFRGMDGEAVTDPTTSPQHDGRATGPRMQPDLRLRVA